MKLHLIIVAISLVFIAGCAATSSATSTTSRESDIAEVTAAEIAFANTMVARNHDAFLGFISEEAIFLNGGKPLRGKAEIGVY